MYSDATVATGKNCAIHLFYWLSSHDIQIKFEKKHQTSLQMIRTRFYYRKCMIPLCIVRAHVYVTKFYHCTVRTRLYMIPNAIIVLLELICI